MRPSELISDGRFLISCRDGTNEGVKQYGREKRYFWRGPGEDDS